jgi:23S rRNA (cytosine1962-C5)-methyltransferase
LDILNRIRKNYKHRSKWAKKNNYEAYRLFDRDIPDCPYIVDVFGKYLVAYFRGDEKIDGKPEKQERRQELEQALLEISEKRADRIIWKSRFKQKGELQYTKFDESRSFFQVTEGQAKYWINVTDYLDNGLFLDHRPFRQKLIQNKSVNKLLNLFSYTGSIGVCAALVGARTINVDTSSNYLSWAKRNYVLNGLRVSEHSFLRQDVDSYLNECNTKFDLIFLDPPTFSNSKNRETDFEVERDQVQLVKKCMRILSKNGKLVFSNNKRGFKLDASLKKDFLVQDISTQSIPEDFRDKKIHQCFEISHTSGQQTSR